MMRLIDERSFHDAASMDRCHAHCHAYVTSTFASSQAQHEHDADAANHILAAQSDRPAPGPHRIAQQLLWPDSAVEASSAQSPNRNASLGDREVTWAMGLSFERRANWDLNPRADRWSHLEDGSDRPIARRLRQDYNGSMPDHVRAIDSVLAEVTSPLDLEEHSVVSGIA
jgi:hypothetical protein